MTDGGPSPLDELRDEIAAIYAGDPDEFVAARTALVKRLRADRKRDAATLVSKLRKPTLAAWALNAAIRHEPQRLDEVVAAGEALQAAQRAALRGGASTELRAALEVRRAAIRAVVDDAARRITERGGDGDAARGEITATLEAASLDPQVAAALRAGRLDRMVPAPSGLDLLDVGGAPSGPPRAQREPAAKPRVAETNRAVDATRAAAAERAAEAARAADAAHAVVAERREAVTRLEREAARLARELDQARRELDEATRAARRAERAAEEAARRARS